MSKPVKEMIVADYQKRFNGLDGALVIDIRGITANENNEIRDGLFQKKIRVTVVKNTLAKKAIAGTALENIGKALEGPSALAFGGTSVVDVAREVVAWAKKIKSLNVKGAVLDGMYFEGQAGVKRLSEFPTKEEAQATVVTLILSPARKLMGAVKGPGGKVMGIIKEVQTRLEDGKAIAPVA